MIWGNLSFGKHICPSCTQILGNFGIDVLKALSGTCGQLVAGKRASYHLATDAFVALMVVTLHALVLMCQVRGEGSTVVQDQLSGDVIVGFSGFRVACAGADA